MTRPNRGTAKLLALLTEDKEQFLAKLRAAFEETGNYPDTSKKLDVPKRTLQRWAEEFPTIVEGIKMRERGKPARKPQAPGDSSR